MENIRVQDRLIKYRKLLNVSREDLAGEDLSVNLITLLETGKRKLTLHTASKLVKKLNQIGMEKGVFLNIGIKDLIVSEQLKAKQICINKLEELKTNDFNKMKYLEVLELAKQYDVTDIIYSVSEIIGNQLYSIEQFSECIDTLAYALTYQIESDIVIRPRFFNRIGASYFRIGNYENALKYFNCANDEYKKYGAKDAVLLEKILYNLALGNSELGNYKEALGFIEDAVAINAVEEQFAFNEKMLHANICYKLGEYENALNIYKDIITKRPEDYVILHNISSIYHKLNKSDDSISYLTKSVQIQLSKLSEHTTFSLMKLGQVYNDKHMYAESIVCYENAIRNTKVFNQWGERLKCYESLYTIHRSMNKIKAFEKYVDCLLLEVESYNSDEELKYRLLLFLFTYVTESGQLNTGKKILEKFKEVE